jgi:hypothetical protein
MKTRAILPLTLLLLLLNGCTTLYSVLYTDQDESVDFTKYKTFAWLPHDDNENTPYHNQIIENNTKNYFAHEFMARTMTVDVNNPDILLELLVKSSDKTKTEQIPVFNNTPVQNTNNPYANPYNNSHYNPYNYQPNYNPYQYQATSPNNPYYSPYHNQYNYNVPVNYNTNYSTGYTTRTVSYTESTITLNVIDRKQNQLVWTSVVQGDLYDPTQMSNNLHDAVHSILDSYPIKPIVADTKKKNGIN